MHETADDLATLQRLLDRSYAAAGAHLKSIVTPDRRLHAGALAELLTGVRVLNLATVTAAGHPRVGPVDGLFYRGQFADPPPALRAFLREVYPPWEEW